MLYFPPPLTPSPLPEAELFNPTSWPNTLSRHVASSRRRRPRPRISSSASRTAGSPTPSLAFFKSHGFNDTQVKELLSWNPRWLFLDVEKTLAPPSSELSRTKLRDATELWITDQKLRTILRYHPKLVIQKAETLRALISSAEGFGVARTSGNFHWTLWMLSIVSVERFDAQMNLFGAFGWSEADFLDAFRKTPAFFLDRFTEESEDENGILGE
ncbi:hypothetical protein BHE74_00040125 [Ensete ventricosum]|nr:hypothetical protein BHE74_00040125 [Ensete ventricosum]